MEGLYFRLKQHISDVRLKLHISKLSHIYKSQTPIFQILKPHISNIEASNFKLKPHISDGSPIFQVVRPESAMECGPCCTFPKLICFFFHLLTNLPNPICSFLAAQYIPTNMYQDFYRTFEDFF